MKKSKYSIPDQFKYGANEKTIYTFIDRMSRTNIRLLKFEYPLDDAPYCSYYYAVIQDRKVVFSSYIQDDCAKFFKQLVLQYIDFYLQVLDIHL